MMSPEAFQTKSQARTWISPVGTTPLAASGRPTILMCPPKYFTVEYAINPWMENASPCDEEMA
jgi:hypothetical protein